MLIPYTAIDAETLMRIVEEFITREGTDYGEIELDLETKVMQLIGQIKAGEVLITFDEESETVSLINKKDAARPVNS